MEMLASSVSVGVSEVFGCTEMVITLPLESQSAPLKPAGATVPTEHVIAGRAPLQPSAGEADRKRSILPDGSVVSSCTFVAVDRPALLSGSCR